ncbi:hypothetical protein IMSHALPRED_008759 [Imshaugia aleurites]|uniref:Uncharacterized protein n=1 Tax=Imshaugia aleurites TaxID=172621 RepID=A0A8H3FZR0_9LECA|nr:hypothetical protein IMSHALPRED_008759 [Imshaugia aleurites]
MGGKIPRVAVRNVKELQAIFDRTENLDYQLRRDLADAQTFLVKSKAKEKAKRKEKAPTRIKDELVEAEKEAGVALTAANKAKKASKKAKKTAKASTKELRALRQAHSSKKAEDADIAAERQLHDANAGGRSLQRRLSQVTQDLPLKEPAEITDKQASVNSSEDQASEMDEGEIADDGEDEGIPMEAESEAGEGGD